MINRWMLTAISSSLLGFAALRPAIAHHSFAAAYDTSESITITGTIVEVRLTNPHSWFFLDVENGNGEIERWAFEAGTPSGMIRNGYSPKVIKQGDEVTITGFHARDESKNAGMLRQLVTADGTVYGMFGPQENPGAR
jgi:DNA/RNA endonuclease YhcR with UshA esterase domain